MAQRLNALARAVALALAALPSAGAAMAQAGLSDPTRPPVVLPGAPAAAGVDVSAPRLKSILISPGRKLAVIDGKTVVLGDKVGEATLVEISETQVKLRQGTTYSTLDLYPGVAFRPVDKAGGMDQKKGLHR